MADNMASDKEMSLYVTQIRYLEEELDSCQRKQEQRENKYNELVSQLAVLQEDVKIQTGHLKSVLAAKEKKVTELLDRLEKEGQDASSYRDTLMLQHSNQMQEMHELMDSLDSDNDKQVERLEEQKKDLIQLKWRLSAMGSLRMQLESREKEHTAAINAMIEEELLERDRKVQTLQSSVDTAVTFETMQTLEENRAQHRKQLEQLHFMKTEAVLLQEDIDALRVRERDLYPKEDEMKKDFRKIIQQKSTHKKEVDELSQTCQQLMVELKDRTLARQRLLAETEALGRRLSLVHKDCHQKSAKIAALQAKLQKERSERRKLERVEQEAAIILRHILSDSEKPSETQWKIQRLLEILESSAPQEAGPASVRTPQDRMLRPPASCQSGNSAVRKHPAL